MNTAGGHVIELRGAYFGPFSSLVTKVEAVSLAARATLEATGCAIAVPHELIRCVSPPGVGSGYAWRVSVGAQTSAFAPGVSSFMEPVITSVSVNGHRSTPTAGGVLLDFVGSQLGNDNGAITVTWNGAVLPNPYVSAAHTAISVMVPAGQGPPVSLAVWIADQRAVLSASLALLPFDYPSVSEMLLRNADGVDCSVSATGVASAPFLLVLRGASFGFGNATTVTVAGVPCPLVVAESSHTSLVCSTQQCGGELRVHSCVCVRALVAVALLKC
jgi:hypothetical protein